ncbi:hypothetical protein BRADI_3g08981v3 [Brachypodium distachyon]|uniref:Uncharacterized protein n=1 Tax=Brachypodium distachyon TaxID=15368 RepID=I1HZ29_BRADI|nr:hypothetical protein BRADI_3g08981v3 [Brachypodium distachyon]
MNSSMRSKLLALVLAMAVACAGGLAILVSAEERAPGGIGIAMAPFWTSAGVVGSPWRRRALRRGEDSAYGLGWRWNRLPPSGPSHRGHAVVTVAPEEEEKKISQGTAEDIDSSEP